MTCKVQERTPPALPSPCSGGLPGAGRHGPHRGGQDCRPLPTFVSPGVTAGPVATSVVAYVAGLGGLAPWGRHPKT
mgnify:CR=1 FL=1